MSKNFIGIDFGAENIMIAYMDENGQIKHIVDDPNKTYIKNYLYIENNEWKFSHEAKKNANKKTSKGAFFQRYKHQFPNELNNKLNDKYNQYKPSILTEKMIAYLKDLIKKRFREINRNIDFNNTEFVITVPVGWNSNNHAAIYSQALSANKIYNYRLVEEPIAASVSLVQNSVEVKKNSVIAILDIGSSTTDLTIVKNSSPLKKYESLRDESGGDFFDRLVLKEICSIDKPDDKTLSKFSTYKEGDDYDLSLGNYEIDEDNIIEKVTPIYVERLLKLFDKLETKKIDYVIFAGGMSGIRFNVIETLSQKLQSRYSGIKVVKDILSTLKMNAICNGATLLAKDASLIEYKMDYSIWFEVVDRGIKREIEFIKKDIIIKPGAVYYLKRVNSDKKLNLKKESESNTIKIIYKDGMNIVESTLGIKCDKVDGEYNLKAEFDKNNILKFFFEDIHTQSLCELDAINVSYNPNNTYIK